MLEKIFWVKHRIVPRARRYYFQQDGATAHTANSVQDWLRDKFGNRFMSKEIWPPGHLI